MLPQVAPPKFRWTPSVGTWHGSKTSLRVATAATAAPAERVGTLEKQLADTKDELKAVRERYERRIAAMEAELSELRGSSASKMQQLDARATASTCAPESVMGMATSVSTFSADVTQYKLLEETIREANQTAADLTLSLPRKLMPSSAATSPMLTGVRHGGDKAFAMVVQATFSHLDYQLLVEQADPGPFQLAVRTAVAIQVDVPMDCIQVKLAPGSVVASASVFCETDGMAVGLKEQVDGQPNGFLTLLEKLTSRLPHAQGARANGTGVGLGLCGLTTKVESDVDVPAVFGILLRPMLPAGSVTQDDSANAAFEGQLEQRMQEIRLQQRDESDEPLEASPILADERPPQAEVRNGPQLPLDLGPRQQEWVRNTVLRMAGIESAATSPMESPTESPVGSPTAKAQETDFTTTPAWGTADHGAYAPLAPKVEVPATGVSKDPSSEGVEAACAAASEVTTPPFMKEEAPRKLVDQEYVAPLPQVGVQETTETPKAEGSAPVVHPQSSTPSPARDAGIAEAKDDLLQPSVPLQAAAIAEASKDEADDLEAKPAPVQLPAASPVVDMNAAPIHRGGPSPPIQADKSSPPQEQLKEATEATSAKVQTQKQDAKATDAPKASKSSQEEAGGKPVAEPAFLSASMSQDVKTQGDTVDMAAPLESDKPLADASTQEATAVGVERATKQEASVDPPKSAAERGAERVPTEAAQKTLEQNQELEKENVELRMALERKAPRSASSAISSAVDAAADFAAIAAPSAQDLENAGEAATATSLTLEQECQLALRRNELLRTDNAALRLELEKLLELSAPELPESQGDEEV